MASQLVGGDSKMRLAEKVVGINWVIVLALVALAGIGMAMLYSAGGGEMQPWARGHALRFAVALTGFFIVVLTDLRLWLRGAYWLYGLVLALLVAVEVFGEAGGGAQRWIELGPVRLQPSELMKVALVLALARYFHSRTLEEIYHVRSLAIPALLVLVPVVLIVRQPDLGTGLIHIVLGTAIAFVAGVRLWKFLALGGLAVGSIPVAWQFLAAYQKERLLTYLGMGADTQGAGYHVMQSKIAFGSGGVTGKGYLEGSQAHLDFLPEKQTDFIFTMFAEEFGLLGSLALLGLFALVIAYGLYVGIRCVNQFGRLVALGVTVNLSLYVFINMGMVMGLLPVVGVPLPLISFGGTAMIAVMGSCGLMMNAAIHRDQRLPRRAAEAPI